MQIAQKELFDTQIRIETEALRASSAKAQRLLRTAVNSGEVDRLPEGQVILKLSIKKVTTKLEELFRTTPKIAKYLVEYEPYMEELAYVIIVTLLRELSRSPVISGPTAIKAVAKAVAKNLGDIRLRTRGDNLQEYVHKRFKTWSRKRREEERLKIINHHGLMQKGDLYAPEVARFTSYLLDAVIASGANIIQKRTTLTKVHKTRTVFTMTEEALTIVRDSREWFIESVLQAPPLVVPPKPWTNFTGSGGYYKEDGYQFTAVKPNFKGAVDTTKLLEKYFAANPASRDATLGVLNKLSQTSWRVNAKVLKVMTEVFEGSVYDPTAPSKAPRLVGGLPIFEKLEAEDYVKPEDIGGIKQDDGSYRFPESSRGWREYYIERDAIIDHIEANHSRAVTLALALSVAKSYSQYQRVYFSYSYDYRGRVYPLQQHLQPQGAPHIKALLQFAEGAPLRDEEAVKWFKVHGSNCYGHDKLPFAERVTKIDAMHKDILRIAEEPMGTRDLWSTVDSPWEFLAWCFEYAAWYADRNHPVSLAVALDASCSGIQMYSGLLRDYEGATATNVVGDTRSDLYQEVADRVNEILRDRDYADSVTFNQADGTSHSIAARPLGDSLKDKITRSIVKQPTMTTPYSVSERGINDQLVGVFKEIEADNKKFWVGSSWQVAKFLTPLVQRAIGDVVKASRVGQDYLKKFAKDVGKRQKYVFYKAPLTDFPVILSASRSKKKRINTIIGKFTLRTLTGQVDITKLSNGIAPNFVHSLDGALLAETVNRLNDAGITDYHLVHDSYGVHPNNVDVFNRVVRETFKELFECDPLQSFVDQVWHDYEHSPSEIMLNTLNLDAVLDSKYIFS